MSEDIRKMIDKVKNFKQFVNEQHTINENDIEQWMSGECIPFCVALNEIFPQYQIAVMNPNLNRITKL